MGFITDFIWVLAFIATVFATGDTVELKWEDRTDPSPETTTTRTTIQTTTAIRPLDPLSVYYDGLGWFFRNGSFSHLTMPLSPEELNTRFFLFTSSNQTFDTAHLLNYSDPTTFSSSSFMRNRPTRIFVHGFTQSHESSMISRLKDGLFNKERSLNYIVVDWERGSRPPAYWKAASNTQVVGAQLARTIELLISLKRASAGNFHIICLSLGCHVSGHAGKRLFKNTGRRPGKITALDPAGPLFEGFSAEARLNKGDADFVEIVHGNAMAIYAGAGGLGLWSQIGDLDFYPNGGETQPGCPSMIWGTLGSALNLEFGSIPHSVTCNHVRVVDYALETLQHSACRFSSVACDSYAEFKEGHCSSRENIRQGAVLDLLAVNRPSQKKQFLLTHAYGSKAYCGVPLKVSLVASKSSSGAKGVFIVQLVGRNATQEAVPLVVGSNEQVLPGGTLSELVLADTAFSEIQKVRVFYQKYCFLQVCSSETVALKAVLLDHLTDNSRETVTACFNGATVTSGAWTTACLSLPQVSCRD